MSHVNMQHALQNQRPPSRVIAEMVDALPCGSEGLLIISLIVDINGDIVSAVHGTPDMIIVPLVDVFDRQQSSDLCLLVLGPLERIDQANVQPTVVRRQRRCETCQRAHRSAAPA